MQVTKTTENTSHSYYHNLSVFIDNHTNLNRESIDCKIDVKKHAGHLDIFGNSFLFHCYEINYMSSDVYSVSFYQYMSKFITLKIDIDINSQTDYAIAVYPTNYHLV